MSKTVHSTKLIPYDSVELDQLSFSNGDIVYDNTNATLRLMDGYNQGGIKVATRPWVQNNLNTVTQPMSLTDTTESTSSSTGSLKVFGGAGIAKNLYIGGELHVTGLANLTSTLNVVNDFSVATNKFTVDHTNGNAYSAGTLTVTNLITANGGLTIAGSTTPATELFKITNGTSTTTFQVDSSSGNTAIQGTLNVTNLVTANNGLTISGTTTPALEYFTITNGSGTNTLQVDSATGSLIIGNSQFTVNGTNGNTIINGTLNVNNLVTANNGLTISGTSTPATEYFTINNGTTTTFQVDSATGITNVGSPIGFTDTGIVGTFANTTAGYNQLILQNLSSSSSASASFLVSNNLTTSSSYYGEIGINSSTFSGTGSYSLPNAVYVTSTTGDLVLGTTTSNAIHFIVNNGSTDAVTISSSGILSTANPNISNSITSPSATFNLVNTTPTTVNFAGAATTVNIGAATGTTYVKNNFNVAGNTVNTGTMEVDGNFQVGTTAGGKAFTVNANTGNVVIQGSLTTYGTNYQIGSVSSISGPLTTVHSGTFVSNDGNDIGVLFNYYDTSQKNGFFGFQNSTQSFTYYTAATNTGGVFSGTLGNAIFGNATVNNLVAGSATANIVNTTATTVNAFGAGTTVSIGGSTGTTTINNTTVTLSNATTMNINGTNPSVSTSSTGTVSLFNTNATTINAFGAASTINFGTGNTVTANIGSISTPTGTSTLALNGSTVYITTPGNPAQMYIAQAASGQIYLGGPGATLYLGTGTGNNTLNILGNGPGGTATIASNITVGTVNNWASVTTGTINFGVNCTNVINIGGSGSTVTFGGSIVESSSIALKQNVQPITGALALVNQLQGVTYDRKNGSSYNEAGLIAEAVNTIIPNLVKKNDKGEAEGINYTKLTAYLIEAVKELTARVDQLTKK